LKSGYGSNSTTTSVTRTRDVKGREPRGTGVEEISIIGGREPSLSDRQDIDALCGEQVVHGRRLVADGT